MTVLNRELDGVYFRVERGGKWHSVCFSDMTKVERDLFIGDRPLEWWKNLAYMMGDRLRQIGDALDLRCE